MTGQSALITGATGFVGSHLGRRLVEAGWKVHVIVRPNSDLSPLVDIKNALTLHVNDGTADTMQSILTAAQPAVVFHLASLFLSEHRPKDIDPLIQSNLLFGTQLIEAMTNAGVTALVNTGTSWQHYENRDYSPVNLYAATKQAFEALLQYYVEARGMRVITLKLFDTYGPDDPRNKLIKLLLHAARTKTELSLSPGEQLIDLVHISDVISAYLQAAELLLSGPSKGHERFGVSSGNALSLKDLVSLLEEVHGIKIPAVWGGRAYRQREVMNPWQPDLRLPGWETHTSLREGLRALRLSNTARVCG